MEIERKFVPSSLPKHLEQYASSELEQAYLCTEPVVRVRRDGSEYYLTYKGSGMLVRAESNLPLTKTSYEHLLKKADGRIVTKRRYRIPLPGTSYTAELDVFSGSLCGLWILEVEFPDEASAHSFCAPSWFGREVTFDPHYHNSYLASCRELPAELFTQDNPADPPDSAPASAPDKD